MYTHMRVAGGAHAFAFASASAVARSHVHICIMSHVREGCAATPEACTLVIRHGQPCAQTASGDGSPRRRIYIMIILCAHVKEAAHLASSVPRPMGRVFFPGRGLAHAALRGRTTHVHPGSRTLRRTAAQEKKERKIGSCRVILRKLYQNKFCLPLANW